MVTILVKEQVIFLVIAENREIPVTIIVTFFGDNIVTKYSDDFFTGNGDFPAKWITKKGEKSGERKGDVLGEC